MSLSNASESDAIDIFLEGADPAWRAGATGYLALVTGVSVDEADPLANECTYTGYARIALTKATAWSGSGDTRTNANLLQWGKRTDAAAIPVAKYQAQQRLTALQEQLTNFAEPSESELLEFARNTHHAYLARRQIAEQIVFSEQELQQWP